MMRHFRVPRRLSGGIDSEDKGRKVLFPEMSPAVCPAYTLPVKFGMYETAVDNFQTFYKGVFYHYFISISGWVSKFFRVFPDILLLPDY